MGKFCTVRDVRLALTPSGSSDPGEAGGTGAELPDWQIEDAILEAEGTVASFVLPRYKIIAEDVEIDNPEDISETWIVSVAKAPIRGWTRDVAAYLIALTYRRNKDLSEDDPIRLRFGMVLGFLRDVRDGKMDLDLDPVDAGESGVEIFNLYEGKMFDLEGVGLGYSGTHVQRFIPRRDVI